MMGKLGCCANCSRRTTVGPGDRWFVGLAWFLSMVAWLAVLLGELGALRVRVLVPLTVVAAAVAVTGILRLAPSFADPDPEDCAVRESGLSTFASIAGFLVLCVALFTPPYATFLWASDSTVYLNLGQEMSRNGGFRMKDPMVTEIPAAARAEMFRNQTVLDATGDLVRLPGGFRIESLEKPEVFAGFSPVFPALNAVVFSLFGVDAMPYLAPVFATLSVVGLFLLGRAVASTFAGWAAALLALSSMPQLWFGRFSMPAVVAEFFVVSGLLALSMAIAGRSSLLAAVAGWLVGIAALTKFELIPILTIGLAAWVGGGLLRCKRRPPSTTLWFAAAYSIPLVHAGIHYSVWPSHYRFFVEVLLSALPFVDRIPVGARRGALGVGVVVAIIIGVALVRSGRARAAAAGPRLWGTLLVLPLVVYFPGYFLATENQLASTAAWLGWYLSWPALVALAVGAAVFLWRSRQTGSEGAHEDRLGGEVAILAMVLLAVAGLQIIYNPQSSGEQIWSARRLVPVIVPMTALLLGVLVLEPLRTLRPRTGPMVAALVLMILGAFIAMPALVIVRQPLWQGARETSAAVAASLPEGARVIVSGELSGTHLATTLNYTHQIPTFVLQPKQLTPTVIGSVIESWLDADLPVLLIVGGQPFSFFAPQLGMVVLNRMMIDIPVLERTRDRPPAEITRDRAAISVFRLFRRMQPRSGIDVGDPTDDSFFQISGFYGAERDERNGGQTFRWTTSRATIVIPVASGLRLTLASGRPPGAAAARVSIYVDRVPLAQNVEIGDDIEELTFDRLPELPGGDASPVTHELAINSSVFVPEQVDGSPDARRLGVRLYRVEFLAARRDVGDVRIGGMGHRGADRVGVPQPHVGEGHGH